MSDTAHGTMTITDAGSGSARVRDESREHFWGEARLLFRDLVFALMIMALVLVFVAQPVKVEGTSMLPRLRPSKFYDLVVQVAIIRPGPIQGDMVHPYLRRRRNLEKPVYPGPSPEHIKRVLERMSALSTDGVEYDRDVRNFTALEKR